jgi:hypothetical protein
MSLAPFPHLDAPHTPRRNGGKLLSTAAASFVALRPQPHPQLEPFLESDFRGFPQIHRPSLQYKRSLFPLRNE